MLVVVENVAGATGNVGHDRVAKRPADGTQLLMMETPLVTNQFLYPHLSYDPERDFVCSRLLKKVKGVLLRFTDSFGESEALFAEHRTDPAAAIGST
jgi:tripartite-type tricarboxylate transporter receptor subunit TctC